MTMQTSPSTGIDIGNFRPPSPLWTGLAIAGALTAGVGSLVGLARIDRIYGGETESFIAQAVAQDLVNLVVVAPLLLITSLLARRGSPRAYLVWLGALAFTIYNYVIYTVSISFGPLFLVWVAALGFALFALIGAPLAFIRFALLGVLGLALAVRQESKLLAVFAVTGGFLAPILAAGEGGSHVALFSYYAALNGLILAAAWLRSWRELNLVGFVFTLLLGSLWGAAAYRGEFYASVQPFLAGFFLLYAALPLLFARKAPPELRGWIDGPLVFGTPLSASLLQWLLVRDFGTQALV